MDKVQQRGLQSCSIAPERPRVLVELTNPHGAWRVLIREDGIAHRPSLIAALTPEEILMYWSLLSPEQREAFIEKKMQAEARQEGLTTSANNRLIAEGTVFDQFSGVYHAFGRLSQHVEGRDSARQRSRG